MHTRILAAGREPIKNKSVNQYLQSIGEIFAAMGAHELRHHKMVKPEFWLGHQLATYANHEPPPTRVSLILVSVLQALYTSFQSEKNNNSI